MQLTHIQYDAILQCIEHGRALLKDGDFIDPYAENPEGYTEETLTQALNEVEKIITSSTPI